MKNAFKKSKYFLIMLFSSWFLIFPAYLNFSTLDDLDLTYPYLCFEKIDQEDSIPNSEKKEKILELIFFIKHILIDHLSLTRVPNFPYPLPALNSELLILRC